MSSNPTHAKRVLAILLAAGVPAFILGTGPSAAQGVTQNPPAQNESQSMPQPPNSLPSGARTLAPGSTGLQQIGTVGTTRVQPKATVGASPAPSSPGTPTYR